MSSSKRRKLNNAPQLSAFAARSNLRILKSGQDPRSHIQVVEADENSAFTSNEPFLSRDTLVTPSSKDPAAAKLSARFGQDGEPNSDAEKTLDSEQGTPNSSLQSQGGSAENLVPEPSPVLSTFRPSKSNVKETEDGSLTLTISPGERLVILGKFNISVRKGQVTLLGATLRASETSYTVFAPSTHSLPVLRCSAAEVNEAEIKLHQCDSGIDLLKPLSSLFGRLWNDDTGALGPEFESVLKRNKKSTFQIIHSSKGGAQRTYLQPVTSSPEWNQALSRFPAPSNCNAPIIMICGPKGSGKSTFAKLLTNRLLSPAAQSINRSPEANSASGVAMLDLDPGQPEYSAQGQLSLIYLNELNFGPQFTHPVPGNQSRIIRAHSIGALTPSSDPALYVECVLDLFAHYRNLLSTIPSCPLVINTPGWVLGTGLEILVELITKCQPTEVVYMSLDGPQEVVETLQDAARMTSFFVLPSQGSEYTTRTAAHLRAMQAMSYFHLKPSNEKNLIWDGQPLTSLLPWEVRYSGNRAGILGIMCYGDQPPPSLLLEAINGSLLAIVVVEDMAAIPSWDRAKAEDLTGHGQTGIDSTQLYFQAQKLQTPLIVHTAKENIPYFNPQNSISLSPRNSRCLGLALLRGVDIPRQKLQLLTPICPKIIEDINEEGKSIVLVSGKFDTPGWAYVEELVQCGGKEKEYRKGKVGDNEEDMKRMEEDIVDKIEDSQEKLKSTSDVPWVEKLKDSQGRGMGARVWRVRRDLGRGTDTG